MPTTHRAVSDEASPAEPASRPRAALACLSLCLLLASLGTSIANVGLPTFARAFDASFQHVQWIVLAYLLAITSLVVSVGRLGDLVGHRRLLRIGIALFTGASALCGVASTLGLLIAARAAQGVGSAIMMALAVALVGEAVPRARLGRALGLLGTMSAVGTALGPSLGGALITTLGWRVLFGILVALGALALGLAHRALPPAPPVRRPTANPDRAPVFDVAGTVVLALTLAAYALGMTLGRGSFGALNLALLLGAIVGVGVFLRVEAHAALPLLHLATFRDPALRASLATSALVSTVLMATLVVGPFHLTRALGLPPAAVGLALSVGPLVAALTGVPAGRVVDRLGAPRVARTGLIAIAAGCALVSLLPAACGVAGYLAPIVVITLGYALFQTANQTAVMSGVHADQRGVRSGLLNLARNLGLITGASVLGAVFAFAAATTELTTAPPAAIALGTRTTFAVATALIAVALALSAGRLRRAATARSTR